MQLLVFGPFTQILPLAELLLHRHYDGDTHAHMANWGSR